ncbi:MAG: alpha/beta fold hydrolase [Actinobacteria bacterium]|nr:alpha/beta fold hydrolase [Actinomycetota bacterium]
MIEVPETRYARAPDGAFIAFQVFGSGTIDVLLMPGFFTNLDENWRIPEIADTHRRIGGFSRVIAMDRRGVGLSDRLSPGHTAPLETHVDDLVAVLDAAKARDVCLVTSESGGSELAILFAAAHPERVRALAIYAPIQSSPLVALGLSGSSALDEDRASDMLFWGADSFARKDLEEAAPSIAGNPAAVRAWGAYLRAAASPGSALAMHQQWLETDVRDVLSTVRAPTLILIRPNAAFLDLVQPFVTEIEARIPGARVVELPGRDLPYWGSDRPSFVAELEEFFTGTRSAIEVDEHRGLATVLFTDIVNSTARSADLGDRGWQDVRARHDSIVRRELAAHRGSEIKTMGDGFLATFDGPARGVRCARTIVEEVRPLEIELRAGLHTGEITREGDDISGIAVAIGARVVALAGPSEVLVSQTVKDLVAGSGLTFEDADEHELKGVPDRWHLYRVVG